jgi:hypothetical protein
MKRNHGLKTLAFVSVMLISTLAMADWVYRQLSHPSEFPNGVHVVCFAENQPYGNTFRSVGTNASKVQGRAVRQCQRDDQSFRCVAIGCRLAQ